MNQTSIFICGLSILALTSVEGYNGYVIFVWVYGIFLGNTSTTYGFPFLWLILSIFLLLPFICIFPFLSIPFLYMSPKAGEGGGRGCRVSANEYNSTHEPK
jgi:hypothetical protein